jgi:hypothetical protein
MLFIAEVGVGETSEPLSSSGPSLNIEDQWLRLSLFNDYLSGNPVRSGERKNMNEKSANLNGDGIDGIWFLVFQRHARSVFHT